ncbi:TlpA family protein disulfide reductase [Singulisphaera acidiphila]|uniref:Thiol-disulfide isomerase-like thioredoxin n=1 Tax=Singulisphaera acidiphila (strain ATCC BAA-1392 / DSM 18658 / VKM B-2454 / MOB10) TaxID=886293 RepID=L0D9J1_SINAD|nr:TlpA disulfide reductase family protein [Singulisphaera acidiphila]AGA25498.1 thiol-disulfide isomerase-like thioredoxin [Singulisphaera acidiphila DSM 18658]
MRFANLVAGLLTVMLATPVVGESDTKPTVELARLKKEVEAAWEELDLGRGSKATEAEQKAAGDRYYEQAAGLARRALALAEAYPDAPEAAEAVAWVISGGLGGYSAKLDAECDAAYDLMAKRYLDTYAILPVVRTAWSDSSWTAHAEAFLRAAVERTSNSNVKALACFSLGRHQQQFLRVARYLEDPLRGKEVESHLGPENVRRIRAVDLGTAKREAKTLYERTLKEFADLQPMGKDFPPLGEQAAGALFRLQNLEIGCAMPKLEGEDVDGKPLKLSDSRGQVVVLSFWATWCGPCMGMVPQERTLVERMKGRPFVLIGVNGDEDRAKAKTVSAKEGITWRSFWDGGPHGPISVQWGVSSWPTVYLVDANGIIRNENLRGEALDRAVEALVTEVEGAAKQ